MAMSFKKETAKKALLQLTTEQLDKLFYEEWDKVGTPSHDSEYFDLITEVITEKGGVDFPYYNNKKDSIDHPRRKHKTLKRAVTLAVLTTILGSLLIAQAIGLEIPFISNWTRDIFQFGVIEQSYGDELLRGAVVQYAEEQILPLWLPEGMMMADMKEQDYSDRIVFDAIYENDERSVIIQYIIYDDIPYSTTRKHEIDNEHTEPYIAGQIKHYVMSNMNGMRISWITGNCFCIIDTYNIEMSDVEKIINSIYEE